MSEHVPHLNARGVAPMCASCAATARIAWPHSRLRPGPAATDGHQVLLGSGRVDQAGIVLILRLTVPSWPCLGCDLPRANRSLTSSGCLSTSRAASVRPGVEGEAVPVELDGR